MKLDTSVMWRGKSGYMLLRSRQNVNIGQSFHEIYARAVGAYQHDHPLQLRLNHLAA